MENVLESKNVRVHCVGNRSSPVVKLKKIVTPANAKKEFGNAQIKHAVHVAGSLETRIMSHLIVNVSISWESVHIIS